MKNSSLIPRLSGIYYIRNTKNENLYIGSGLSMGERVSKHIYHLRRNSHHNEHLQRAYNKYGEDAFEFGVIDVLYGSTKDERILIEEQWVLKLGTLDRVRGYNIDLPTRISGSPVSEETRRKISVSLTGRKLSIEHREKLRETNIPSEEARKKISQSLTGRKQSEETKRKRANSLRGQKRTPEQVERVRNGRAYISYRLVDPNGEVYEIPRLKEFCVEKGLSYKSMHKIRNNPNRSYKGWRVETNG